VRAPIRLGANDPRSFYRGSHAIRDFRGATRQPDEYHPEDWIASVTSRFGLAPSGQTVLDDGTLLLDAIAHDPVGWLGPEHVARYGADPRLLTKLLDAGERLPVHVHPDRAFAGDHLASGYGKTESWIIIDAPADAAVHLGFARDVDAGELERWCRTQDLETMLAATNRVPVRPGDSVFVPAGLPHAIGPGILLAELQEPTDFSIFLEWAGFDVPDPLQGQLGLDFEVAIGCVNRAAVGGERLATLGTRRGTAYYPAEADAFFRADRLEVGELPSTIPAGYGVLIVLDGSGRLATSEGGELAIARGDTILLPYAAGDATLEGPGLAAILARPPE
jgi:mannose-6-phosphate isomerase